jgi:hypothetical protein
MADQFDQLKLKYGPAVVLMKDLGVEILSVNMQGNKLYIKGLAPTQQAKNQVWDEIKIIDEKYEDLICDISVEALPAPAPQPPARMKTYTVQKGDTLSKIARVCYGDASKYNVIFDANKDILKDPNVIHPGQVLNIPAIEKL